MAGQVWQQNKGNCRIKTAPPLNYVLSITGAVSKYITRMMGIALEEWGGWLCINDAAEVDRAASNG